MLKPLSIFISNNKAFDKVQIKEMKSERDFSLTISSNPFQTMTFIINERAL